jgi:NAD(P)-dependent dehydrogenase (short-subunit alcohol dehydrogenase family)
MHIALHSVNRDFVVGREPRTSKRLNALPRYAKPDEIAGMVAYLASPEAAYITSASLMIDGGFNV